MKHSIFTLSAILLTILTFTWGRLAAQTVNETARVKQQQQLMQAERQPTADLSPLGLTLCQSGMAGVYPCNGFDLMAFMPLADIGGGQGNDIWGWTDPATGREYALFGRTSGTSFVEITDPVNPIYLGNLPTHTNTNIWRDIKTYENYAFIVADYNGAHGMQVFDLTQLRDVTNPPVSFSETAHYNGTGSAHNVAINEASGYAYIVGISSGNTCNGGLHMVDIHEPLQPTFVGCYGGDGYTHDAQCVIYHGPDTAHQGDEICFNANIDTLTIVDVTDKTNPTQLARLPYTGSAYAHQGWLTADHHYFYLGDEGDEINYGHNTRTYIWDVADLANVSLIGTYTADTAAIDHNLYTHHGRLYQANYRAGLRVLTIGNDGNLTALGYFDIYPFDDSPTFNGAWSNYPFFSSGTIIVSGIEQGLFVLRHSYLASLESDSEQRALPEHTVTHEFILRNQGAREDTYDLSLSGNNWSTTFLTTASPTLAAGMTTTVIVSVTVPAVMLGEVDHFTLTAVSTHDPLLVNEAVIGTTLAAPTPGLRLTPTNQTQTAEWSQIVTYTLTLTNTGDYTDTFTLVQAGNQWPTNLTANLDNIMAGEIITFSAVVQVPDPFDGGGPILANDTVAITAVSTLDPLITASATITTHIDVTAGLITSGHTNGAGQWGETVIYTIDVTNTGEITDTFFIALGSSQWESQVDNTILGPLAVNGRATLTVFVTVGSGNSDSLTLTLTSQLDNSYTQSFSLTTTRLSSTRYLPFISKPGL